MGNNEESDGRSFEDDECDHSSNDEDNSYSSSSEGEYSDDSRYLSDGGSQGSFPQETLYQRTARSVVRRRAVSPPDSLNRDDARAGRDELTNSRRDGSRNKRGRGRNNPNFFQECFSFYADACPFCCNRRANIVLFLCFSLWLVALFHDALTLPERDPMTAIRTSKQSADVRARLRNQEMSSGRIGRPSTIEQGGFWGQAQAKLQELMPINHSRPRKPKSRKKEALLAPGCKRPEWQSLSFPNCNQIHEFNLQEDLGLRRRGTPLPKDHFNATMTDMFGYVGAGLWRTVWKVRGPGNVPVVIKMMKGEHDVDSRNMDRHRRDALSMERLTSSPNIVSIYGHCGNTVLTEHLPRGLDTLVYHNGDTKQDETVATRQTRLGRLHLALHVARGVAAIHELPGGPIIHADIQAKQFLVDPSGTVKLNDFNRCRFMSNNTKTGKPCTVTIPSAPGSSRSPEEYKYDDLTEKLDVFSTGHVLFAILTGKKPWEDLWGSKIKQLVKAGRKPPIRDKQYLELGTSDAALANLIDLAYELDPRERVSASQLVAELERLVAAEEAKQNSTPSSS